MYSIKQITEEDCGFTCLKFLLYCLTNNKHYLFLSENLNKTSYSLLDLKIEAEKYNLKLKGYKYTNNNGPNKLKNTICLMNYEGFNHYVMVIKIGVTHIEYFDPKLGIIIKKLEQFLANFTKNFLAVESFKKIKFIIDKPSVDMKTQIPLIASFIFEYLLIGLFGYSFYKDQFFYIPYAIVILYAINYILRLSLSKRLLFNFDERNLKSLYSNNKMNDKSKNYYQDLFQLKSYYFQDRFLFLSNFLQGLFVIVLLIINGIENLLFLPLLILYLFCNTILFNKIKSLNTIIKKKPDTLNELYIYQKELEKKELDALKYPSFFRVFYIFILFILNLFIMLEKNLFAINFILFNIILEVYISESFMKCIAIFRKKESYFTLISVYNSLLSLD